MNSNNASNDWVLQSIDYFMYLVLVSGVFLKIQTFIYCYVNSGRDNNRQQMAVYTLITWQGSHGVGPRDLISCFVVEILPYRPFSLNTVG